MGTNRDRWVRRWKVPGSNGNEWTVAVDEAGNYGCSCPRWKFKREECHHIMQVKAGAVTEAEISSRPKYVLAMVETPILKDGELFIPLVAIGDTDMEATICYTMLENGYSMGEIKEMRHIPRNWTAKAITAHVERYGKAVRPIERRVRG